MKEIIILLFSEFPNDLKMMAFLAGELSVSTKYFSTFANVNTDNCDDCQMGHLAHKLVALGSHGHIVRELVFSRRL